MKRRCGQSSKGTAEIELFLLSPLIPLITIPKPAATVSIALSTSSRRRGLSADRHQKLFLHYNLFHMSILSSSCFDNEAATEVSYFFVGSRYADDDDQIQMGQLY